MLKGLLLIKTHKYLLGVLLVVAIIVFLPPLLHRESYIVLNNDTKAHLEAFKSNNNIYIGQLIVGKILVWVEKYLHISIDIGFMWFNYICLYLSGLSVSIMVYQLTKNKIISIIVIPMTIFGCYSVLHLFYCGTIFNIISVCILLPIMIACIHYLLERKNRLLILLIVPMVLFTYYFHPSLGRGILEQGKLQEAIINPLEATMTFLGIFNMVIIGLCIGYYLESKCKSNVYQKIILIVLMIAVIGSFAVSYTGATPYPSRVLINAFLFICLMMFILMGIITNTKIMQWGLGILAIIAIMPSLVNWVSNCIIKGVPASEILSS